MPPGSLSLSHVPTSPSGKPSSEVPVVHWGDQACKWLGLVGDLAGRVGIEPLVMQ